MARKFALALCLAWLMLPVTALGLGLGDMHTESALNEPFEARVILHSDRPAELRDLDVRLASPEAYDRAGILRSDALLNLRFEVRDDVQPPYIAITSRQPIREPFLSLLLEIGHPRGRLQREYTVLLDPPTMMPSERREARAPVTEPRPSAPAPQPERAEREPEPRERWTPPPPPEVAETEPEREPRPAEPVAEPAPERTEPAPRPRPVSPAEPPAPDVPDEYRVRRGDTLWELADRFAADEVATHQMMLAIFERNPEAFRDNINIMHEGAVLRVPSRSQASAYSLAEAAARIERDRLALRGDVPPEPATEVAETEEPRLELVAPGDAEDAEPEAIAPGVSEDIAAMSEAQLREALAAERARVEREREQREALESEVGTLREEVDALEQLIALGVDDIAAFEARLAEMQAEQDAIAEMTFIAEPVDGLAQDIAERQEQLALEAALAEQVTVDEEDVAAVDDDEVEAVAAVDEPAAPTTPVDEPSGGFMDDVTAALNNPMVLGGILGTIALLGLLAFQRRRRAGEQAALDDDDDMEPVEVAPSTNEEEDALFEDDPVDDEDDQQAAGDDADEDDDESDEKRAAADDLEDDPLAGDEDEDSFELPEGDDAASEGDDPASEADFHLSYGMYDEALEAVDRGLADAPDDEELKAKRLEILSAAGKQDEFLEGAREFSETHGTQGGLWAKIADMGRELAPGEALFSDDQESEEDPLLDFGEDSDASGEDEAAGEIDLSAEVESDDASETKAENGEDDADLDFDLSDFDSDDSAVADDDQDDSSKAADTSDDDDDGLAFDLDLDEAKGEEEKTGQSNDEAAADDAGSDDDLSFDMDDSSDSEAEEQKPDDDGYSLDVDDSDDSDLSFDTDDSSADTTDDDAGVSFDEEETAGADVGEEMPPLPDDDDDLEAYDEIQTRIDLARAYIGMDDTEGAQSVLEEVLQEGEERHKKQARDLLAEITGEAPDEKESPASSSSDDDASNDGVDVSGDEPLGEGDDIGTQLDLARAYVDMGDEDGAAKLIEQVLSEGNDEQKREAQALKEKLSS